MKIPGLLLFLAMVLCSLTSCSGSKYIEKRRYTSGYYSEFTNGKQLPRPQIVQPGKDIQEPNDTVELKPRVSLGDSIIDRSAVIYRYSKSTTSNMERIGEVCPRITKVKDSAIAHIIQKDSLNIFTDSLPAAIEVALSTQGLLAFSTVGALATMAAPDLIWFTFLPILLAPGFLLVSLIAAMVVVAKLNNGQIAVRYKKYMRLWALLLVFNLAIAAIVITQQTWF